MAEVTDTVLKTYFETSDVPTEENFIDLVDSKTNVLNLASTDAGKGAALVGFTGESGKTVADLSSTDTGKGASLIGVEDVGSYYSQDSTTVEAVRAMCALHPKSARQILIEDKANGPAIIDTLRRQLPGIVPISPQGSKVARALRVQGLIDAGNVYLKHGAPWVSAYLHECGLFPSAAHDDQVDATSQALEKLHVAAVPINIGRLG